MFKRGDIDMMSWQRFMDYLTFDEDGFWNGVREDTPEEIKLEYEEYLREEEELQKLGIKR
jgi:hypothetical protein